MLPIFRARVCYASRLKAKVRPSFSEEKEAKRLYPFSLAATEKKLAKK
jgi:hypothetical protein